MSKPSLLFLTDLANGSEDEDIEISDFLKRDFEIQLCHPRDCEPFEDVVDAIIIRNIWNEANYGQPEPWYKRWRSKPNLPIHDDLYIRSGDFSTGAGESKDYLMDLTRERFPVIPSVDDIRDIKQLPDTDTYFIKPKDGFDAINARKLSRAELVALNPKHYLIQPFIDFEYEISFYYLDKQLQYTLYAPDKMKRWDLIPFTPSEKDIQFAETFIRWNKQRHGIERIDACRLKNGELLLIEISDQGGVYLSVPDLPQDIKTPFLEKLSRSIRKVVGKTHITEKELWSYFSEHKVSSARPFDRDFIWVKKEDFQRVRQNFVKEFNFIHSGESFRSMGLISHIHAVDQGDVVLVHFDIGNVARFFPTSLIHLFADVIPYYVFAWFKRTPLESILTRPK
jgi:hypothetical protein